MHPAPGTSSHPGGTDTGELDGDLESDLVWHYTNGPGLVSILTHHVLWATSASFLNDQQEVALGGALVERRLLELGEEEGADAFFAEMARQVRQGVAEGHGPSPASFYILSAAQTWDSLVMWRNYGGAQESYAIGLAADEPLQILGDRDLDPTLYASGRNPDITVRRTPWQPVRYTEAEQLALVDAVFDELPEEVARLRAALESVDPAHWHDQVPREVIADLDQARDDLEQALLLIKHPGFVDERETRKAVVLWSKPSPEASALAARLVHYRPSGYGMAPYLELTGTAPDAPIDLPVAAAPHPLPIRAVAISPSPNGHEATESLRGLLASRGYAGVPVLRSAIPFRG